MVNETKGELMIKSLEVKGLNTKVDADLEFEPDLNIITGANGSGKTTLLKLMWYLISGQIDRALYITFEFVSIVTDQFELSIAPQDNNRENFFIQWSFSDFKEYGSGDQVTHYTAVDTECSQLNAYIAQTTESSIFFPSFRRIEGGFSHIHQNRRMARRRRFKAEARDPFQDVMTQFAEQQSNDDHKFVSSFSMTDIEELVPRKYLDISEAINQMYADLLRDLKGKIFSDPMPEHQVASSDLEQIRLTVDRITNEEEALRNPLTALNDFVDGILKQRIAVTEKVTLGEESSAKSSDELSSGEQQMLSFLCYNAFSSNTTIFIDEPELSLHINWQRILIPVLFEQRTGNQFFMATHSPFIYTNYPSREFLIGPDRGGEIDADT
ncbi:MAG: AAA family ATPase [Candidatus Poribacteria bacterium]|nr:AAA family ATPase [Candidatus Poribacteria bacterium]